MAKAVYKCPVCDYCTHFPKALEAHQRFRKHFPKEADQTKKEAKPVESTVKSAAKTAKRVRKPRTKKAESKE